MRKITIKDIAKLSGVSFKTVSRVINNEKNVKDTTRERVEKLLREFNFSVNYNAKRLASNSLKQIAIITNTEDNELNKNYIIMNYILKYGKKRDYTILVYKSMKELIRNNFGKIDAGFYEGVIFLNPKKMDEVQRVCDDNIPVVVSGISDKYIYVGTDQFESAYLATKSLVNKKCRDIGIVLGDPETRTNIEKVKGYKQALRYSNIRINMKKIMYNYETSHQVENLITKFYLKNELFQALIIGSDILALGAVRAVNKLGIKCPEKFKFISFGNTYICTETYPTISSIKQNFEEIARQLVDKIINIIENDSRETSFKISAEIIERESTI